ncbi:MAG: hypothetical protein SOY73_16885 [Blautia sp.]|nr:hypothetical protein [Blautia sp.]
MKKQRPEKKSCKILGESKFLKTPHAGKYADEGAMIDNYNYNPDDHISMVGASMQKYLAGVIDREELADEIQKYWFSVTPVEH